MEISFSPNGVCQCFTSPPKLRRLVFTKKQGWNRNLDLEAKTCHGQIPHTQNQFLLKGEKKKEKKTLL